MNDCCWKFCLATARCSSGATKWKRPGALWIRFARVGMENHLQGRTFILPAVGGRRQPTIYWQRVDTPGAIRNRLREKKAVAEILRSGMEIGGQRKTNCSSWQTLSSFPFRTTWLWPRRWRTIGFRHSKRRIALVHRNLSRCPAGGLHVGSLFRWPRWPRQEQLRSLASTFSGRMSGVFHQRILKVISPSPTSICLNR